MAARIGEQITRAVVGTGERIAVVLVAEHDLAFVVGTPQSVAFVSAVNECPLNAMASAPGG